MTIDPDDPLLTALALGELDEAERARLEAELAADPGARAELEQLRELAAQLEDEFAAEPTPTLTADQRGAVLQAALAGEARGRASDRARSPWKMWAAAAGVGLLLYGGHSLSQQHLSGHDEVSAGPPELAAVHVTTTGGELSLPYPSDAGAPDDLAGVVLPATNDRALTGPAPAEPTHDVQWKELLTKAGEAAQDGRLDEAIAGYTRAVELGAPGEEGALYAFTLRGKAHLEQGNVDKAAEDYRRALELLPNRDSEKTRELTAGLIAARTRGPEALGRYRLVLEDYVRRSADAEGVPVNPFVQAAKQALSTFSIDVDTAAYAGMRRSLREQHAWPAPAAVRIEELINYFDYDYAPPAPGGHPFAAHVEVAGCPWNTDHRLVRIGLKGYEVQAAERPASNLVFLLDVSGSMSAETKLPLLKQALRMLVSQLTPRDRVAIVVYAGASGLVLDSTPGDRPEAILTAIERLNSGGSTNGGAGIELAYAVASRNYLEGGINRVILATDGDFNVGVTQHDALLELIERKAKSKVFLSVLGLGMRDAADRTMEQLADRGNGVYSYLDTVREAKKVLVDEISGTLFTIAKDVKLQLEFNPARVASYRLIGYENRVLAAKDFNDDTKDAGEIGAGHTVTALYEVVPVGAEQEGVDPLRYPQPVAPQGPQSGELLFLKLRYKQPEGDTSQLMELPVVDAGRSFDQASQDFRFAAAVAAYGMILRHSPHKGTATLAQVQAIAQENPGLDRHGYRAEFVELVALARKVAGQ
ncbi:MAG: von Willebrand factor type A domain-containing protein [Planctomycetes bacterium]|nr:von Willebrand factor type A domain-containing protein [Planctomycetota bacterium]